MNFEIRISSIDSKFKIRVSEFVLKASEAQLRAAVSRYSFHRAMHDGCSDFPPSAYPTGARHALIHNFEIRISNIDPKFINQN